MKKLNLLFFCFFFVGFALCQEKTTPIQRIIENAKTKNQFSNAQKPFFFIKNTNNLTGKFCELKIKKPIVAQILETKSEFIKLNIPFENGTVKELLLHKKNLFSNDIQIINQGINKQNLALPNFVAYYGVVNNQKESSLISLTVTKNTIRATISIGKKEFTIAPKNDMEGENDYVLFEKNEVKFQMQSNSCGLQDNNNNTTIETPPTTSNIVPKCVTVHFEISYVKLNQWGGVSLAIDKFLNIFNTVQTLYKNENIVMKVSYLKLWSIQDPYLEENRTAGLFAFTNNVGTLQGNIGHLLNGLYQGGIAFLGEYGTCNRFCVSGMDNSNGSFPFYSWNANVMAHEMGHTLGSNHTQYCGWPGGAIDNCYTTEGGCAVGPAPVNGGTIMSYCHLTGYGINFNNGFGPLPGNTIRNTVNNTPCFTSCDDSAICTDSIVRGIIIKDNGIQFTLKWQSQYSVKIYKRTNFSQPSILIATVNAPLDSLNVPYLNQCSAEKTEFTFINVCPLGDGKPVVIITEPKGKKPFLNYTTSVNFCPVDSLLLKVNVNSPNYIYQWKLNNTNIVGANNANFKANLPGYYQCQYTMPNGCVYKTDSLNLIPNTPASNFYIDKDGLTVNFIDNAVCADRNYTWNFGNGNTSNSINASQNYITNGIYNVCHNVSNVALSNQKCSNIPVFNSVIDELNQATLGNPTNIFYSTGLGSCDYWAGIFNPNGSRYIVYDNYAPKKGTIEFLIRVTNGWSTNGGPLQTKIFYIGDVPNQSFLQVSNNGQIIFRKYNSDNTFLDVIANTPFTFSTWQVVSISYGSGGIKIAVNGTTYATNTSNTSFINLGINGYSMIGGGNLAFAGMLDKVRFSYAESDFQLSLPTQPPTATINANTNNICQGTNITFTATTNAPTANYQWKKNGVNVGTNSATYTDNALVNGNTISCTITATSGCFVTNNANSNTIVTNIIAPVAPITTITASTNNICPGTSINFTANTNAPTANYQWKKNGVNIGTNNANYSDNTLVNNDQISCFVTATSGCFVATATNSNIVTITVLTPITPTVNIIASRTNPCVGELVTFTATNTNSGATPTYQWKKNGVNIATTATYSTTTLINSDIITCVITPSAGCYTQPIANSNSITINLRPIVTPTANIASSTNNICANTNVTFTATTNIINPSYQWKINGSNVATNNATYASTNLANNDIITCTITAPNADCYSVYSLNTNAITIIVKPLLTPLVTITSNDADNIICQGVPVVLNASSVNGGSTPLYQWKVNNVNVNNITTTFTYIPTNNDNVSIQLQNSESCVTNNIANSNIINIKVPNVNPVISRSGYTVQATSINNAAAFQWYKDGQPIPGANNKTYDVILYGNYTLMETFNTCSKLSNSISIQPFLNNKQNVRVYPNPTNNWLYAQTLNANTFIKSYKIFDNKGALLFSENLVNNNTIQIDVKNLSNANYIIIFTLNNDDRETIKFLKQ